MATVATKEVKAARRIEKHHHTKRECDVFIVVLPWIDKEEHKARRRRAKAVGGGWYCRKWQDTPGGYAFLMESDADVFLAGEELRI